MKKIMFGNSLMLLGIAIMILAGLKVIYVGTLWVSFLLIIVGFVMATIVFFIFFGFFSFFFEGKLSHILEDELFQENKRKAQLEAYKAC